MKTANDNLKTRLKGGEVVVGPWCTLPSAAVLNVVAATGLDFVIIDLEHGPAGYETAEDMVRAAEVTGCAPLVRVARNEAASILKALDIGAHGVLVPHIASRDDAERAIAHAKYYPLGERGFSPFTRAGGYSRHRVADHSRIQNQRTLLALMLEGKDAVASLDDILAIEKLADKVDIIYIGAYDLSQAVGFPGQVDHPEVRGRIEAGVGKINRQGIAAGAYVAKDKADMAWMCGTGMQFITLMPDATVLFHAYEALYHDFLQVAGRQKENRR